MTSSKTIACRVHKINLNRTVSDEYTRFIADKAATLELTVLQEEGVKIYTRSIERMMEVMGSAGRY
jgi:fructose-bisphosphate aldolase class II